METPPSKQPTSAPEAWPAALQRTCLEGKVVVATPQQVLNHQRPKRVILPTTNRVIEYDPNTVAQEVVQFSKQQSELLSHHHANDASTLSRFTGAVTYTASLLTSPIRVVVNNLLSPSVDHHYESSEDEEEDEQGETAIDPDVAYDLVDVSVPILNIELAAQVLTVLHQRFLQQQQHQDMIVKPSELRSTLQATLDHTKSLSQFIAQLPDDQFQEILVGGLVQLEALETVEYQGDTLYMTPIKDEHEQQKDIRLTLFTINNAIANTEGYAEYWKTKADDALSAARLAKSRKESNTIVTKHLRMRKRYQQEEHECQQKLFNLHQTQLTIEGAASQNDALRAIQAAQPSLQQLRLSPTQVDNVVLDLQETMDDLQDVSDTIAVGNNAAVPGLDDDELLLQELQKLTIAEDDDGVPEATTSETTESTTAGSSPISDTKGPTQTSSAKQPLLAEPVPSAASPLALGQSVDGPTPEQLPSSSRDEQKKKLCC